MAVRIAINGFGRTGRMVLRAAHETRCENVTSSSAPIRKDEARTRNAAPRPILNYLSGPGWSESGRLIIRGRLRRGLHEIFLGFGTFSIAAA